MHPHHVRGSALKWIASASVMEAIVAIAIIALSIVGLAGVYSLTMAAIATIITAAAVLLEGGAFDRARMNLDSGMGINGLSAEMLGAVAGVILGVLALMGVAPVTLLSIAVLVFGVTFLLNGAMSTHQVQGGIDGHVLIGMSVAVLGLLSVIGISPVTLVLVGLLILGAMALFGGSLKGLHKMRHEDQHA